MALSNSVIRRYTPPTCTLEVLAKNSPLSRWMGKSVLKNINFELCFDDPRQAETGKQVIRGDREQLEALCTTVTNYVQECLQQSPANFWVNACGGQDASGEVSEDSEYTDIQQVSQPNNTFTSLNTQIKTAEIHLKPGDNLTHNLFLGSLANQGSDRVINLSVLQLFDLANALDEYSSDVMALPNLHQEKSVVNLMKWAPVAAVMAIAVGLAPFTLQYARNQQKTQTAEKPTTATTEEKTALSTVPSINFSVSPNPSLAPSDTLAQPQVKSASSPTPNSATPKTPLPPVPTTSTAAVKVPTAPRPSVPAATVPTQSPVAIPAPGNSTKISSKPGGITAIPSNKLSVPIQPNIVQPNIAKSRAKSASPGASPNFNITNNKPLNDILASNPNSQLKKPVIPTTTIKSPPSINSVAKPPAATNQNNSNSIVSRLRQSRNKPPEKVATGTLFDTTQIAEARNYFKKRWQPPSSLKTALEYSLMVAADGKIERIEPLNKAARDYVDRSGIPLIGEAFISPNQSGKSIRIRTVLRPDGSVQTLPEGE